MRESNFSSRPGIVLVVGNEKNGISEKALKNVDKTVHIDMFGNNSSMNVSSALAIALYKISEDFYNKKIKSTDTTLQNEK